VTEIEIRDPDPGEPGQLAGAAPGAFEPPASSPYQNLLVPLVVVPALIVMVLVLLFVLFGAVAGKEDSPRENLDTLLHGGFNERKQAAFALVRQVLEFQRARAAGEEPEFEIDAAFLPELRAARAGAGVLDSPGDVPIPLVLSSLLAQLGDPEGIAQLIELTRLAGELDPEREYRLYAMMTLAALGPDMAADQRARAAQSLVALLESEDAAIALVATAALQRLPSPETIPALRARLVGRDLEQRASAALSLAVLGDASGVPVLREALGVEAYAAERASDSARWPPPRVADSRARALGALLDLGAGPEEEELRRIAAEDPDPAVRRRAAEGLARASAEGGG
jgi:hypothetical protein